MDQHNPYGLILSTIKLLNIDFKQNNDGINIQIKTNTTSTQKRDSNSYNLRRDTAFIISITS